MGKEKTFNGKRRAVGPLRGLCQLSQEKEEPVSGVREVTSPLA